MILVGQYDSPVTRRVAVALHHYGMPFTRDTRSIFGEAQAVAKISPLTRIPALVLDDGEVLIDSAAILDYLDEEAGDESGDRPLAVRPRDVDHRVGGLGVAERGHQPLDVVERQPLHPSGDGRAGLVVDVAVEELDRVGVAQLRTRRGAGASWDRSTRPWARGWG